MMNKREIKEGAATSKDYLDNGGGNAIWLTCTLKDARHVIRRMNKMEEKRTDGYPDWEYEVENCGGRNMKVTRKNAEKKSRNAKGVSMEDISARLGALERYVNENVMPFNEFCEKVMKEVMSSLGTQEKPKVDLDKKLELIKKDMDNNFSALKENGGEKTGASPRHSCSGLAEIGYALGVLKSVQAYLKTSDGLRPPDYIKNLKGQIKKAITKLDSISPEAKTRPCDCQEGEFNMTFYHPEVNPLDFKEGEEVVFEYRLLGNLEEIREDGRFIINRDGETYVVKKEKVSKL